MAEKDGIVEMVDDKLKVVRVRYAADPIETSGDITTGLNATAWHGHITSREPVALVVPGSQATHHVVGSILKADGKYPVRVTERLVFSDVNQIPGKERMTRAEITRLEQKLKDGDEKELVFLRLTPVGESGGDVGVYRYGDRYTSVSGSKVRQELVANVKTGESVKKGDVLIFNRGFFTPDRHSKQVAWNHGVLATVALMERSITLEDSCEISQELSQKLEMKPAHDRPISITSNTVLHQIVKVGDVVQTTDRLCTIEDGDINSYALTDDPDQVEWLADLNKKSPKAKYSGTIAEIKIFYSCELSAMHPTVAALARSLNAEQKRLADAAKGAGQASYFPYPEKVPVGTKYMGVEFAEDTVLILITITEGIPCVQGDKVCFQGANKSVVGGTMAKPAYTTDGMVVDAIFSGTSINNRIVNSPLLMGTAGMVLKRMNSDAIAMYFDE